MDKVVSRIKLSRVINMKPVELLMGLLVGGWVTQGIDFFKFK